MTEVSTIQIMVCEDAINRMKQAKDQKSEAAFALEKNKLLDALAILKTADLPTYTKYSRYSEVTFHSDAQI